MGYSEILCQICGVSFNIGRTRTVNEPQEMAWDEYGYLQGRYLMTRPFAETDCPPGCMITLRELDEPVAYLQEGYADPADGDGPTGAFTPAGSTEVFYPECPDPAPKDGIDRRFKGIGITHALEHIAGPECRYQGWAGGGYNGNNISVEEMRGCTTSQCLVPKDRDDDWEPDDDDEDFEKEGKFFLSGLSDEMPSRDMDSPTVFPARHGCSDPRAENHIWDDDLSDYALPFHPTCLEVFKRASLHRSGKIDYEGLEFWWQEEGTGGDFSAFPRDPAVAEASEQWWLHGFGDEWLAANSCYVPGLEELFNAVQQQPVGLTVGSTAKGAGGQPAGPGDVFAQLPQELRTMIAVELDMTDVAALRVASRSFWNLPQAVVRALMIRQRPWLWEAWSSLDYSFWTTTTAKELKAAEESRRQQIEALKGQLEEAISKGGSDSDRERIERDMAALRETGRRKSSAPVTLLDTGKTNWFMLRKEIMARVKGGKLKGLRNRERIWKDCNEILDRAETHRREGRI